MINIIKNPDSSKVVEYFDELENNLGIETFKKLIPIILTDVSNQKPNVENMNKQLRLFFPKKKSIDKYSKNDIKEINKTILNRPLRSLDNNTPKEAFIKIFDESK